MCFVLHHAQFKIARLFLLTVVFTCSLVHSTLSQSEIFTPGDDNKALLSSLYSKLEKQHKNQVAALPPENRKELAEVYTLRWNNIKEKFDQKEIYTSDEAQKYLDALIAEIVKSNPELQKQVFNCYFSKSDVPNASYVGEGIILFNMGLFQRLDNESQAAFVLSHELAHFILRHSENSIHEYVAAVKSKEVQDGLRKIKKTEYKKREGIENLLKGLTFDTRRHSRHHESEADSMALELLRNTRFDLRESLTTLALLDSIDTDTLKTALVLQKIFDAKGYPFRSKWIAKEEGLLGGHAKLDENELPDDSLKTHPDCKVRIRNLENAVKNHVSPAKNVIDKSKFEALKSIFRYEVIEYNFTTNNYPRSLYYTLALLQQNPGDPYLITQTGKIFNAFFLAQKSHTLGKVTSLPSPGYQPNYNLLLQFVQNLYKEDFASISYHFLNRHYPQLDYYAPFKKEYNTSIQIAQE